MNVKDLITGCDETLLSLFLFAKECTICDIKEELYETVKNECKKFVQILSKIEPVSDGKTVLLCMDEYQMGERKKVIHAFNKDELDSFDVDSIKIPDNIADYCPTEISEFIRNSGIPNSYAIELEDWNKILGYEVDKENIKDYGEYIVSQEILYEMAYFGMEDEDAKATFRDDLAKRAEEARKMMENPDFAPEGYFISAEEVFKKLGVVKKPKEAWEEEIRERSLAQEALLSFLEKYRVIKKYRKSRNHSVPFHIAGNMPYNPQKSNRPE